MNNTAEYDLNLCSNFPVTLLVPEKLYPFLRKRSGKFRKKNYYLRSLLEKFSDRKSLLIHRHKRPTACYQKNNLDLVRFDFKTQGVDWFKLKIMALECGLSMSALFVFMLKMDIESEFELTGRVPTFTATMAITTTPYSAKITVKYPKITRFYEKCIPNRIFPYENPAHDT